MIWKAVISLEAYKDYDYGGFTLCIQRKGKANLMKKIESKQSKVVREKVEEKILYLVQLWSDTFMMKED